jgi:DNA-3-methyladenine glycosylase II
MKAQFTIPVPLEFNFELCLEFLRRSPREVLHRLDGDVVRKLVRIGHSEILFELRSGDKCLEVVVLHESPTASDLLHLKTYIGEWFDLATDLKPFYLLASRDKLLKDLAIKYYGYRIVGQPDLFESMVWAILGQQINLQFAYTLKQRFVEHFGSKLLFEGTDYYLFPKPETVALLTDDHLLPLQFSRQKSKYTVLIAEAFATNALSRSALEGMHFNEAKEKLMKIKGVGNWTANYALMKTFRYPDAFPLEDVGIHNAIRILKKMDRKPTLEEVKKIFKKYKGWEAYATLYLWKSL